MKLAIIALLVLVAAALLGMGLGYFQPSTPDVLDVDLDIAIATIEKELEGLDLTQEELNELEEELLLLGQ